MSLYERSKSEVQDFHRCLFDWCRGDVSDNDSAWERIKSSWASGFRLVDGEGLIEGSKRLLGLQVRFNEAVADPLKAVWLEGFTGHDVSDELFQAFYEEWSYTASGVERGCAWSVLLRNADGQGPFGVVWVHAHRSPLAADAKPSFRPAEASQPLDLPESDDGAPDDVPWASSRDADDGVPDDVPWASRDAHDGVPDDAPWAKNPPAPAPAAPSEPATDVPPLTAIRAFFGDAEAQKVVGGPPPPVFDQYEPECWLRELRKGGPEAMLRASLVVLAHLLEPWEQFFPEETGPRQIHEALSRYLGGDAQALADAKALVTATSEIALDAKAFEPDGPLPEGFRTYVRATNAAEAAALLANAAGGSAIGLGVKLSPILTALPQPTRLALRADVLEAFADQG